MSQSKKLNLKWLTVLAIFTTLVLWASAFVGIRAGLKEFSPFHLALFRYLVASVTLLGVSLIKKIRLPDRQSIFRLALAGIIGIGAYNIALNFGEQSVTAASACFIINTVPIITSIFSVIFLKERINLWGWIGRLVSFVGVSLIVFGESSGITLSIGIVVIFIAALFHGTFIIIQKPLLRKYTSFEVTAYSIWFGMLALLPFIGGLLWRIQNASSEALMSIGYLGVFPGVIAYLCWAYVLSGTSASKASSYLFFIPMLVIVIGWTWLGEIPPVIALIGGLVAISGVGITRFRKTNELDTCTKVVGLKS